MNHIFSPYLMAVVAAAALDVAANLFLVHSQGFKRKLWGLAALILVGLAFSALAFAVRGMDLAVAYAMWGGFGVLGTSIGGWAIYGQKIRPCAWGGIVLLVGGLTVLHLS